MPKRQKVKRVRQGPTFSEWYRQHVSSTDSTNKEREKYGHFMNDPRMRAFEDAKRMEAWDIVAPHYNKLRSFNEMRGDLDYVSQLIHFSGNENVLSLGSGTGILENFIAKYRVPNGKVIAVDISHQMNLQAKDLAKRAQVTNLHLVTGNVKTGFVKPNSQDVVLLIQPSYVSHKFEDLQEVRNAIKKSEKSRFILCTIVGHGSKVEKLIEAIKASGFSLVHEKLDKKDGVLYVYITARPIIYA